VVGIDPGLVHTGVVRLVFDRAAKHVTVGYTVVLGADAGVVAEWTEAPGLPKPAIFIEEYKVYHQYATNSEMVAAVRKLKEATGGKVLSPLGVKQLVKPQVMRLLKVWTFTKVTHHQDLRSAARIAIVGMLKDDEANKLLADLVRDHLNGQTWQVDA
ncbi:MAG TPA: hypothetical protein VJW23_15670, partial [Propionibacteriaceae bacterium]|nr:hypothetical protein [Propionibacteriaceae bacterium]